jgi:tyramine---L-glutamate ligase
VKILVYEHLTATASSSSSLFQEGLLMRQAVTEDFAALPGVEVVHSTGFIADSAATLTEAVRSVDAVFLIAPETDGVLLRLCRAVEQAGIRLLGPNAAAVHLTADKLLLSRHLATRGIPTPACREVFETHLNYPLVCKPRDGAGSQATFLVRDREDLDRCITQAQTEGYQGELLVQRYVPGLAASISFLVGPSQLVPLLPTRQLLSEDGRFHYLGCEAPLRPDLARRAVALGQRAIALVTGLRGYAGVDLVLGEEADGSGDQVIEINPRLTTSYVTLRQLTSTNLMELMLRICRGEAADTLEWRPEIV